MVGGAAGFPSRDQAGSASAFAMGAVASTALLDKEHAAGIDGAGHVRFLFQIMLPLCRAPLLTVGMFTYIGSWNSLAWPLLVTNTPDWRPISVGLQQFVSEAGAEVHLQMAGAVIATVPVLLVYFLVQREFTEGISMSGLKG